MMGNGTCTEIGVGHPTNILIEVLCLITLRVCLPARITFMCFCEKPARAATTLVCTLGSCVISCSY